MAHEFNLRVYADGRLCIPSKVLNKYRELANHRYSPTNHSSKVLEIATLADKAVVKWGHGKPKSRDSARYDLSGRDRVLFGKFTPGTHYRCTVTKSAITIDTRRSIQEDGEVEVRTVSAKKPAKKVETPPKAKRKPKRTRSLTLEAQFDASFRVKLCEIVAQDFPEITLGDLAKVIPDLTIGEIVSA